MGNNYDYRSYFNTITDRLNSVITNQSVLKNSLTDVLEKQEDILEQLQSLIDYLPTAITALTVVILISTFLKIIFTR